MSQGEHRNRIACQACRKRKVIYLESHHVCKRYLTV